ncbi:hypothetical protein GJW-30_1_03741 [Variibacter gotjawalensis]|uniref:Uncharacterized protein n=2 Tax=Variibacter gotjawalensis TaxID=1333996 RepID=A0A0S3PZN1_9BRAD|nr:hypothetical protein [Variibacter gotjawalensis]NIK47021.1 hypothetical protein [Variibacter gotjawalensis]RZS48926.1 hypothetical protein EV661_1349 [Variibacter gotjawalensis]BAT61184.1 hypothetical protein GJW-30_1_03741 [Variibacter gotjawalensis]
MRIALTMMFTLAFAAMAGHSSAATFCNPKGSSAPGYCGNIPHKTKAKAHKPRIKPMPAGPVRKG